MKYCRTEDQGFCLIIKFSEDCSNCAPFSYPDPQGPTFVDILDSSVSTGPDVTFMSTDSQLS